jgi:hypothetical protein
MRYSCASKRFLNLVSKRAVLLLCGFYSPFVVVPQAQADKIKNPTAVFSGLDKITGRIISFEVAVNETVQFGALQLTPRICYSRPATENPNTTGFIEVDEVTLDNKYRRIFTGWMFASSPGLHGIEHPVYDVWLVNCKGGTEIIAEPKEQQEDLLAGDNLEGPILKRRDDKQTQKAPINPSGRTDILPSQGVPVQPQQQPSRRFFPNNEAVPQNQLRDPAGSNR